MANKRTSTRREIDGLHYEERQVPVSLDFSLASGQDLSRLAQLSDKELGDYLSTYLNSNIEDIIEAYDDDNPLQTSGNIH